MKLCLHTCCAPCAIYPVKQSKYDFDLITAFFYNPNIHPYSEYMKREESAKVLLDGAGVRLIEPSYDIEKYFMSVENNEKAPERCLICWKLRVFETARFAKENGYDSFTTTLLGSPYQRHEALREICAEASEESGANFYYRDFRKGFRDAHREAMQKGIYCQNYCGCIYSQKERLAKKEARCHCQEAGG